MLDFQKATSSQFHEHLLHLHTLRNPQRLRWRHARPYLHGSSDNRTALVRFDLPKTMNRSFFDSGLYGDARLLPDDRTRSRWVVADALRAVAKGEEKSIAARMRIAAGDIENGMRPSKKVMGKIGAKRLAAAYPIFVKLCTERMQKPNATLCHEEGEK